MTYQYQTMNEHNIKILFKIFTFSITILCLLVCLREEEGDEGVTFSVISLISDIPNLSQCTAGPRPGHLYTVDLRFLAISYWYYVDHHSTWPVNVLYYFYYLYSRIRLPNGYRLYG